MALKRTLRFIFYFVGIILAVLIIFFLANVIPVDRTPIADQIFYRNMMNRLDSLESHHRKPSHGKLTIGYAIENLTPSFPVATAGYGNRRGKNFTSVHDSLYVRCIVIDNGTERIAIVSADLLIIPPTVTSILPAKLDAIGFSLENTYLNATHTHNSIGNWAEGAAGLIYGSYRDTVVQFIAEKIVSCINAATKNGKRSALNYGSIAVPDAVRNRIDGQNGKVDDLLRVIEIQRDDSSKIVIASFNAHPTCLFSKDLELSRDYPGELVDSLERRGYDFAMFLSGAVGSHGCNAPEYGKPCLTWMAGAILNKFGDIKLEPIQDSSLNMLRTPLALGEPQIKISTDWRLRPWIFRKAFGEYQPYLSALRLGDLILLGTPCDFSGELRGNIDTSAIAHHKNVIITSFNGQYIGYITNDIYYDNPHYETRLMNWYGPGNGAYLSECMVRMVETIAE